MSGFSWLRKNKANLAPDLFVGVVHFSGHVIRQVRSRGPLKRATPARMKRRSRDPEIAASGGSNCCAAYVDRAS
jgi:hypothetical protein